MFFYFETLLNVTFMLQYSKLLHGYYVVSLWHTNWTKVVHEPLSHKRSHSLNCVAQWILCVVDPQTDLLGLCGVRQQRTSARLRALVPSSARSAGSKPLLHRLCERTGGGVWRGPAHHSPAPKTKVVGLNTTTHSEGSLKQTWVRLCCWRPPPSSQTNT